MGRPAEMPAASCFWREGELSGIVDFIREHYIPVLIIGGIILVGFWVYVVRGWLGR
jgi:hypothetical protein